MKILGIKATHDGTLALVDNGKLIFSYEMEKLKNNDRLERFNLTVHDVEDILNKYGYGLSSIDRIVIDGWCKPKDILLQSEKEDEVTLLNNAKLSEDSSTTLKLAKYGALVNARENIMLPVSGFIDEVDIPYVSYQHVTGHFFSAYSTSPFAKKKEDTYVLIWDGGMPPQLFYYYGEKNEILNCGQLFLMFGSIYPEFALEFEPFSNLGQDYQISGKLMAYISLGEFNEELYKEFWKLYLNLENVVKNDVNIKNINWLTKQFIAQGKELAAISGYRDVDVLNTFHVFLENLLIDRLDEETRNLQHDKSNLCFVGGCALSIKWNSKIRNAGIFNTIWVPPFPNDAGSAIGAACCVMINESRQSALEWDVYSGPAVMTGDINNDIYSNRACTIEVLANLIFNKNEPVVVLHGRAELGPRALGNRSIISVATQPEMKNLLNKIKGRENYRPVAPICIEEMAPYIFSPGNPDPYMLFDHTVRSDWSDRVPAIVHVDGSARLQTVSENDNETLYLLLKKYYELSGVPVLCNTSANFKGKGFFPDVESVMKWDQVNYIWSENTLFERKQKLTFFDHIQNIAAR